MLVDLLRLAVALQEPSEDAHPTYPNDLEGHTSVRCTLSLAGARVAALAAGDRILADPRTRVNGDWLADDQTVLDQLADVLS